MLCVFDLDGTLSLVGDRKDEAITAYENPTKPQ